MHSTQDNVGGSCKLDKRHTRKRTSNNGCDQRWSNQVCECGKPCGMCTDTCMDMHIGTFKAWA